MRKIFKPYPILLLIILLMITNINEPLIYVALMFGLIGDLLLLSRDKKMFLAGATSFLVEHLINIYLLTYLFGPIHYSIYIVYGILLVIAPIISTITLKKFASYPYTIFGGLYGATLIINVIIAFTFAFTFNNYLLVMYACGYLLFIISDGLIAQKRFIKPFNSIQFLIMITYYLAQYLIYMTFILNLPI